MAEAASAHERIDDTHGIDYFEADHSGQEAANEHYGFYTPAWKMIVESPFSEVVNREHLVRTEIKKLTAADQAVQVIGTVNAPAAEALR